MYTVLYRIAWYIWRVVTQFLTPSLTTGSAGMGAAMMGKPGRLRDALKLMARATDIPLTLKMRTGAWPSMIDYNLAHIVTAAV